MNVTAKHGYGAVHIGGREMNNGRWSPACGTQHHNAGGREVTPLRPTDKPVDCKRCLRTLKADKARTDNPSAFADAPPVRTHADGSQTCGPYVKTARKVNVRANLRQSPEIKRAEKSGIESLRDMLKLY
jgi:hypothetical protein